MSEKDRIVDIQRRFDEKISREVDPPGQPLPNARRFIKAEFDHPERPLLAYQDGAYYQWDGACWLEIDNKELETRLYQWFDDKHYLQQTRNGQAAIMPFAPNRQKVGNLSDALRAVADVHIAAKSKPPIWLEKSRTSEVPPHEIVACRNGLLHVPTRILHPHTPIYFAHHSIPFEFNPAAFKPAKWLEFLRTLWGDDQQSIATVQEIFGYMISGDTRLQKMFLLVGPRRSGKGTIARILKAIMGEHNVAGPTLAGMGTNFGLSALIGRPVAIVADARLNQSNTGIITERLLSISGEDTLTVDRKYREPWTGQMGTRILVLSNELPWLADSSGALASRFIVLTTTQSYYGRENPNLTAELLLELPGILNWALDGLDRLRDRGRFEQPHASQTAIRELEDLGSPIGAFIRDMCQTGPTLSVPCNRLYQAWQEWCEEQGRTHTTNAQTFGRDLRAAAPSIRTTQPRQSDGPRYRAYQGIALARGGTRSGGMYAGQPGNHDASGDIEWTHVPPRAKCPRCDDEGCNWCSVCDGEPYKAGEADMAVTRAFKATYPQST